MPIDFLRLRHLDRPGICQSMLFRRCNSTYCENCHRANCTRHHDEEGTTEKQHERESASQTNVDAPEKLQMSDVMIIELRT